MISTGLSSTILNKINNFNAEQKEVFYRIYSVVESKGDLVPPNEMIPFINQNFGSVDNVKNQDFIRIADNVVFEGSVFNELRMNRPVVGDPQMSQLKDIIEESRGDSFCEPLKMTPADVFGRIQGRYCVTASNIAKYDGLHGIIVFDEHNPLLISRKRVRDYVEVGQVWFDRANQFNTDALYPLFSWSALWRAGASMIHGHAQVVLAEKKAYSKIEQLRWLTLKYQENYRCNYFTDIYNIHNWLGLSLERNGCKLITKITPAKEKETFIFADKVDENFTDLISDTLTTFKEKLGVNSFNVAIIFPPLKKTMESWSHMPVIAKILDRGKVSNKTSDVGPMEFFAQSVIESNPYTVFETLKESLLETSKPNLGVNSITGNK